MQNTIESQTAIVLVNYNGTEDTIECLKSIRKANKNILVVVVDNASMKNEYDILEKNNFDAKILRSETNLGFAGGNNLAVNWIIKNAESVEYIMLLNNDTVIDKNMIRELTNYANPHTIIAPKMYYYSNQEMIWYGGGYINRFTGRAMHTSMNKIDQHDNKLDYSCDFITGCCLLIPMRVFKKIGLLDESYFMYCEDTEFCLRAKKHGVKFLYNPKAFLYHKVSKSSGGADSPFCMYYMTRNRLRYIKEYKEFFYFTAKYFTIFTRYIRILIYSVKKMPQADTMRKAISDYKNNIYGKIEL